MISGKEMSASSNEHNNGYVLHAVILNRADDEGPLNCKLGVARIRVAVITIERSLAVCRDSG
jgi:hypothetical protein